MVVMWKPNNSAITVDSYLKCHNKARLLLMINTPRQLLCVDRRATCLTSSRAQLLAINGKRPDSSRTPTEWPSFRTDPIPVKRFLTLHHLFRGISDQAHVVVCNYFRTVLIYI